MPTEQNPAENQQPTITTPPTEVNPTEKRIKDLSGKVESTSKERDAALLEAEVSRKQAAFSDSFIDIVTANPAAKDHKAEIQAKVMAGYTAQDAAYAVLGPIGKLGNNQQSMAPITGGSAATVIPNSGAKPASEMARDEMRAALIEAQNKGDFFVS